MKITRLMVYNNGTSTAKRNILPGNKTTLPANGNQKNGEVTRKIPKGMTGKETTTHKKKRVDDGGWKEL